MSGQAGSYWPLTYRFGCLVCTEKFPSSSQRSSLYIVPLLEFPDALRSVTQGSFPWLCKGSSRSLNMNVSQISDTDRGCFVPCVHSIDRVIQIILGSVLHRSYPSHLGTTPKVIDNIFTRRLCARIRRSNPHVFMSEVTVREMLNSLIEALFSR